MWISDAFIVSLRRPYLSICLVMVVAWAMSAEHTWHLGSLLQAARSRDDLGSGNGRMGILVHSRLHWHYLLQSRLRLGLPTYGSLLGLFKSF